MQRQEKLAKFISNVLSPLVVAPIFITWISIHSTRSAYEGFLIALPVTLLLVAPAIIYILVQMHRGVIQDIHVKNREQRKPLYIIGIVSVLVTLAMLYLISAPKELFTGLFAVLGINGINFVVNKYTKISIHSGTLAGISIILFLLVGLVPGLVCGVLTALVSWGRVKIQAHTTKQVVLGSISGAIITFVVFKLFGF